MNLKLGVQVRELEIAHGYYSEAYIRARTEGQPVRHSVPVPAAKPDTQPVIDWRTGEQIEVGEPK